jgi:anaerobic selenocysteine-containing dehydrogenase
MKLTRRDFIKKSAATSGVVLAAGTVAHATADKPKTSAMAEATAQPKSPGPGEWVATTCQGCTSWCSAEAFVQGGRVVKVRGNQNSKSAEGYLCPRGHMAIGQMYDPDRIKVPMKRTNPKKGRNEDPKFVPISWDEAIDTIADKMMELRKNKETNKFMLMRGRYTYTRDVIYDAMPKIFGSPNNISHSAICAEAEKFGAYYTHGFWDYRDYDLDNTKYVLMFGGDPVASNRQVPVAIRKWGKVLDQATVAVVDPRLSATASKAHEWLPVIPGEDGALAVAMANVILSEGLWNKEFVGKFKDGKNRFVAGKQVDEGTFEENYTNGVVKWWNLELKDRTPEWAAPICGIPADQIKRVATGLAKAAPNCMVWMAPGAAMQVRGSYAAFAAHALNGLIGAIDSKGGVLEKMKAPYSHIPLHKEKFKPYIDEISAKGQKNKKIDQRGYKEFPSLKKKPGGGVVTNRAADGILNEDPYDIKVAIGYWNNLTFSCTGADRWERALSKLPFFAHITTNAAEMSWFADIVLPAAFHAYERWAFLPSKAARHSYVSIEQPMVKPLWDVRIDETEVPYLIAEKLKAKGFSNMFDYFQKECKDPETGKSPTNSMEFALYVTKIMTQNFWDPAKYKGGDKLSGWEDFRKKGIWQSDAYPFKKKWGKWKTKTHKFEFYSETLKDVLNKHAEKHKTSIDDVLETAKYTAKGEQAFIPHYEPAYRHGDEKEFPFIFQEYRSRLNREGRSQNLASYYEFKKVDPGDASWDDVVKINPKDAAKLGIKEGDKVRVTSPIAAVEGNAHLFEGIRPGTVSKCFGQGHWAYGKIASLEFGKKARGGSNNHLMPADYDRLSGSTARHGGVTRVKIVKL